MKQYSIYFRFSSQLTSKHIHAEAEALPYEEALLYYPISKYDDTRMGFVIEHCSRVSGALTDQTSLCGSNSEYIHALRVSRNGYCVRIRDTWD